MVPKLFFRSLLIHPTGRFPNRDMMIGISMRIFIALALATAAAAQSPSNGFATSIANQDRKSVV